MTHKILIETRDQYAKAIGVLDKVGGSFTGIGAAPNRWLLVTDQQYDALVQANVISQNNKYSEADQRGKKKAKRKAKS